ncbi:MAG: GAF domain-containing protein [Anaerolineales bacterium]|nr:GAF domain-containing protein [Anaerolineales bacterium]
MTEISASSSNLNRWLDATNLAAEILHNAITSEEEVFKLFSKQVGELKLRGGIALHNPADNRLYFKSIAESEQRGILKRFEEMLNLHAKEYSIGINQVEVYRKAFVDGEDVFVPNTSTVVSQMLPIADRGMISRIVEAFGRDPGAYMPIYDQEKIIGVLNIAGPNLSADDMPALKAFANIISAAMLNVSLINELRAQESAYRSLFDNLPVGIFRLDKDANFIMANPVLLKQFQIPDLEQLRGKSLSVSKFRPLHSRERMLKKLHAEGEIIGYESEWINESGDRILLKENIRVKFDSKGEVAFYEGSVEDITHQMHTDSILKKQLDDLMLLNQIAAAGAGATSLDDLLISITDVIGDHLFPDHFGVILWSEAEGVLKLHPSYRGIPDEYKFQRFLPGQGVVGKAFSSGRAILLPDVSREEAYISAGQAMGSELCVPIKAGDRVIGVLNAERKEINSFGVEDQMLLQTIADQIATALDKVTFFDAVENQALQLALLNEAVLTTSRILDPNELIHLIATQIREMLEPDFFTVTLYDSDHQQLEIAITVSNGVIDHSYSNFILPLEKGGLTSLVIETGQVLHVDDLQSSPLIVGIEQFQTRMEGSWVGVPLISGKNVIGALTVQYYDKKVVSEDQTQFLVSLASHAAIAITNGRLFDDVSQRFKLSNLLAGISESLNRALSMSEVVEAIGEGTCELMSNNGGMILLSDENQELSCIWQKNISDGFVALLGNTIAGDQILRPKPWICPDCSKLLADHPLRQAALENDIGAVSLWPLVYEDQTIAVIGCVKPEPYTWGDIEQQAMMTFTRQAAVSIQNARLLESERNRRMEAEALFKTTTALTSNLDLGRVLNNILVELYRVVDYASAGIHLLELNKLRTVAVQGLMIDPTEIIGRELPTSASIVEQLESTHEPIVIQDIHLHESFELFDQINYVRAWIGVPLIVGERMIGALTIESDQVGGLDQGDAQKAIAFANQAAIAIETARLFGQTQRRFKVLQAIHTIDQAISRSLDLSLTFDVLLEQAMSLLNVDLIRIFSFDTEARIFELEAEKTYLSANPVRRSGLFNPEIVWGAVNSREIVYAELKSTVGEFASPLLRGYSVAPLITRGAIRGVIEIFSENVFSPNEEWTDLLNTLSTQAAIAIENDNLFSSLKRSNEELVSAYDRTLEGWAYALELRDRETIGHSRRVTELTMRLARRLGLSGADLANIRRGTLLHDIGKMGLPDSVLLKKGPLTKDEEKQMQKHPELAFQMLSPIPYLKPALEIPYYHHEKWDGSGYPHGLAGEEIPLAARIFAVVDVWDAVVFDRPYREAWTKQDAYEYIREQAGKHFDPKIVEVFLDIIKPELSATDLE